MEWNGHSNLAGMESYFHSRRNGMTPFYSSWNEMSSPVRPKWNDHFIPDRMEWSELEWALHSNWIGHFNPARLECHSFDNFKKYAARAYTTSVVLVSVPVPLASHKLSKTGKELCTGIMSNVKNHSGLFSSNQLNSFFLLVIVDSTNCQTQPQLQLSKVDLR